MKQSILLRAANYIMAAAFLFFAALQYNDPDPIQWTAIYLAAATACIFFLRNKLHGLLPAITGVVALVWACFLAPNVIREKMLPQMLDSAQMMNPAIEEAREMCGLLIVVAWMIVLIVASRIRASSH
jgi:hypothetical protein